MLHTEFDEILTAAHVLRPLADLAPEVMHPALGKTIARLWDEFPRQDMELVRIEIQALS